MTDAQRFRSTAPRRMTVVALLGLAVTSAAWVVSGALGQQLARRHGLPPPGALLLVAIPLAAGSAGLIPAGALTDRYGARRILPAVAVITGVFVLLAGFGTAATTMFAACLAMCVAGTAFAVGASLVARAGRPYRRGFGLSVLAAGIGGAAVAAVLVRPMINHLTPLWTAVLTAAVLLVYAGVAVLLVRDAPLRARNMALAQDIAAVLRMPTTRQWCVLSAVTFGPVAAALFYLPTYASGAFYRPWGDATAVTAGIVAVAAVAQPVGGRLADAGKAVPALVTCCTVAGVLGVVIAVEPNPAVVVGSLLFVAAAAGTAGGVLLCRMGGAVPPERAGLIIGVAACAGGLSGLLPPALLAAAHSVHGQYAAGIMVLSGLAFAAAAYARRRRDWVNPLAFPLLHTAPATLERPEFRSAGTTVVALAADDTGLQNTAVLGLLAELATRQELVIVYGPDVPPSSGALTAAQLVAAVRERLPRHGIAAVLVSSGDPPDLPAWGLLRDLTEDGAVAVAVVDGPDLIGVARAAAHRLDADAFRLLAGDSALGVHLERLPREPAEAAVPEPRPSR